MRFPRFRPMLAGFLITGCVVLLGKWAGVW